MGQIILFPAAHLSPRGFFLDGKKKEECTRKGKVTVNWWSVVNLSFSFRTLSIFFFPGLWPISFSERGQDLLGQTEDYQPVETRTHHRWIGFHSWLVVICLSSGQDEILSTRWKKDKIKTRLSKPSLSCRLVVFPSPWRGSLRLSFSYRLLLFSSKDKKIMARLKRK